MDYGAKSSYVAGEKEIQKLSRFLIHSARKMGYIACIAFSCLKFGHFCDHGLRNSPQFCLFFAKVAIFCNIDPFSIY